MLFHLVSVNTVADLKTQPGSENNSVMTLGANSKGDNMGALYYFDKDSTEVEDTVNFNVVAPTSGGGRWKKVFQRVVPLPQGTLVIFSGVKYLYVNSQTTATGECTVNLTMDNTATGTPIFSKVWFDDSKATINTAVVTDAVSSCRKNLSADNKVLTHMFFRGNTQLLSVLGLNIVSFRSAAAGTAVAFCIVGM